ncbi:hypothetical protein SS50377_28594 [Spironucleus salmonicida]|uniref:Uncharacterized protein n=1 Tax=Spironucleus salmonicida TaxID=348837 RepID=V6LBF6_9EUKA|nr:hypothetical protein SS50377_28594 [Spironucleus salmonicida]|eukprot:EST41583.1 Hypothetical protein SS50377_18924 [Spironucleus salmonicida]
MTMVARRKQVGGGWQSSRVKGNMAAASGCRTHQVVGEIDAKMGICRWLGWCRLGMAAIQ